MTSPMRSASRAAHEMASVGVVRAEGSRCRGFAGSSRQRLRGQQALGDARDRGREEDEDQGQRDVEGQVEQHDLLGGPEAERARSDPRQRETSGSSSVQPISLNRKLPSVTRRASGGELSVDSMPRMPLPRLAPSTSPSATGSAITCSDASVATSSTTARLE